MKFNLLPAGDIEKFKYNELIIKDTAMQVIKDFASFGMEVSFPENIQYAYDSLFNQLNPVIDDLFQREPEKLSALLYQIDLDEKKLHSDSLFSEPGFLCHAILEREFFKVLTRHYFREKGNI